MDRYDVVLQAVDERVDRDEAVHAASVVLELDPLDLKRAVSSLPAKVLEDVDERGAESLLGPLQRAGWRVRLVKRPLARRMSLSPRPFEVGDPSRRPSPYPPARATPYPPMQPAQPRRTTPYPPPSTPPAVSASLAPPRPISSWPPAPGGGSADAHAELEGAAEHPLLPLPELELDLPPAPAKSAPAPALPSAAPPSRSAPPVADEPPEGETLLEFFASLPRTLLVPVRGDATKWLLRSLLLAIGIGLLSLGSVGIVLLRSYTGFAGVVLFGLAASAFWIGHLFAYFRACLWAVIGGDEGPDAPSSMDGDDLYARVFDGAVVIFAFAFVNVGLVLTGGGLASVGGLADRFTIANGLLGMHVPIGLALMAVRQSRGSYFDLITAVKLVITAPIHMLVVLTLSFALSHVSQLVVGAIAQVLTASVQAGHWGVLWVGVPGTALVVLALTLLQWGLLGAAMGAVCRARPGLVS